jgi:hypothetical protein
MNKSKLKQIENKINREEIKEFNSADKFRYKLMMSKLGLEVLGE